MQKLSLSTGAALLAAAFFLAPLAQRAAVAQDPQALQMDTPPPNAIWLDSLDLSQMTQDYGTPHARRSVDDHPLKLKGVTYPQGVGTHASSQFSVDLKGAATRFVSMVGWMTSARGGAVTFQVWVDGKKNAKTGVLRGGDPPQLLTVNLAGARRLT